MHLYTLSTLRVRFTKRQRFIFLSLALSIGIWFLPLHLVLALTFFATLFAFSFDLRFPEHLIFPIYPVLLTLAFWLNRPVGEGFTVLLSLLTLFAFYILLLTLNILNIATIRTVPLKKAALSSLYFLGLIIGFFAIKSVLTSQPNNLIFCICHFALGFSLALPLIYVIQIKSSPIEEETGQRPRLMLPEVLLLSLLSTEIALAASFLRVSPTILSIFLTGILFLFVGLFQHCVRKTLTKKILWEHVVVGVGLMGILVISSLVHY